MCYVAYNTTWNGLLIKRQLLTECHGGQVVRLIRFYSKASNTVKRLKGLYSSNVNRKTRVQRCHFAVPLNRDLGFHTVSVSVSKKSVRFWMFLLVVPIHT